MTQNLATVQHLDPESFDALLASELPVLVDFTARWCSPCRALVPILDRLAHEAAGTVRIASVDADDHPQLSARYAVRAFPTVIAFVRGREVGRHVGLTTAAKLRSLIAG
jgi:thioredoxin 1